MKPIIILTILVLMQFFFVTELFAQQPEQEQVQTYSYAYISVEGKIFSKKLNVQVDLGDTPEQMKEGKEFSEILSNKKSYAAVLNFMVDHQFELVNTFDYNFTSQGSGGTSGIVFIMRKKE